MRRVLFAMSACSAVMFCAQSRTWAATIPINNYSFENATGWWSQGTSPSSWGGGEQVVTSGSGTPSNIAIGVIAAGTTITGAVDGSNVLQIDSDPGTGSTPSTFAFVNDIGTVALGTYAANTTYTLTIALGVNNMYANGTRSDVMALAASNNAFANGAGGQSANWASVVPAACDSVAFNWTNFPGGSDVLYNFSLSLDTATNPSLVGQSIGVVLAESVAANAEYGTNGYFDNVNLTYTADVQTPEPTGLGVLMLGGVALLRRRKAAAMEQRVCG